MAFQLNSSIPGDLDIRDVEIYVKKEDRNTDNSIYEAFVIDTISQLNPIEEELKKRKYQVTRVDDPYNPACQKLEIVVPSDECLEDLILSLIRYYISDCHATIDTLEPGFIGVNIDLKEFKDQAELNDYEYYWDLKVVLKANSSAPIDS
ncbi:MAG: hypothetical protein ACRCXZ_05830 [Patescibacteria group bacterium]